jgi:hypothetical protein
MDYSLRAEQRIQLFDCCQCNECNKKVKHSTTVCLRFKFKLNDDSTGVVCLLVLENKQINNRAHPYPSDLEQFIVLKD